MTDLKDVLDSLVHMAASENDGKSTVLVRIWSDGTCDLEHYANVGEVGEYGVRKRRTRTVKGVKVERIIKGINDLYAEGWTEGKVQAPHDARRQIRDLEHKLVQAREDAKFLLRLVPTWAKETKKGLCPTFYGTGSESQDEEVNKVFQRIRKRLEEA